MLLSPFDFALPPDSLPPLLSAVPAPVMPDSNMDIVDAHGEPWEPTNYSSTKVPLPGHFVEPMRSFLIVTVGAWVGIKPWDASIDIEALLRDPGSEVKHVASWDEAVAWYRNRYQADGIHILPASLAPVVPAPPPTLPVAPPPPVIPAAPAPPATIISQPTVASRKHTFVPLNIIPPPPSYALSSHVAASSSALAS
ncbi:hypothetical protein CVT25_006689 [Psilocybe cyanescens]|uniref:Uncharacterized protein n=1 Tax=Psilocybe cyanescens TaxID=93625 RepID=A0A409XQB5_PSICY|nr:hypothetical protein CVT25_006689 [Psilocybe cyanescens]